MSCKCSPIEVCDECLLQEERQCDCFYNARGERIYCIECVFDDEESQD